MKLRFRGPVLACFALVGLLKDAGAQDAASPPNPRVALIIGEATYADQTLATAANDAALVGQVLQAAGFDVVGARDLDEKSVRAALRDFLDKANAAGPTMQAFVYLAGRAVQYEGDNYFVPVDARIDRAADTPIEAVRVSDFTHALAATPGQARIIVLDGARANPFAREGAPLAGGLALVEPEAGTLIAFNAAPGTIAGDEPGAYGVYAKTLAGSMREGGVRVEDVFAQTRVAVNQATAGAQIPWSDSRLTTPYFIFERAADAPPPAAEADFAEASRRAIGSFPVDQAYAAAIQRDTMLGYEEFLAAYPDAAQARRVRAILAARREALFWRRSRVQDTPRAYWTYLHRYPRGPHAVDAERRLAQLSARAEPPRDFAPEIYADLPPPPEDEMYYADRPVYGFAGADFGPPPPPPPYGFVAEDDDWRDLPPPPPPAEIGVLPALAVAIPLLLTARAYQDGGRRDGHAAHGAPPPPARPLAAPPLPRGVQPRPVVQRPGAAAAPAANGVAPGPSPMPGRPAPLAAPVVPTPAAPTAPPPQPAGAPAAPVAPVAPVAPGTRPGLHMAPVGRTPAPVVTPPSQPAGAPAAPVAPVAPGTRPGAHIVPVVPTPAPVAPVAPPPPQPAGAPAAPGTRPGAHIVPVAPTPAPVAAPPSQPAGAPVAPVAPGTRPGAHIAPAAPAPRLAPPAAPPTHLAPTAPPAARVAPAPMRVQPPVQAPAHVAPAPMRAQPPAQAPVHVAPAPMRAPPAQAPVRMAPPAPAPMRAQPPAQAPVHVAPAPVHVAPPAPAHVAPQPPPQATHVAPRPAPPNRGEGRGNAPCGKPGLPACPR